MIILPLFSSGSKAQDRYDAPVNREAYAAGKFYPGDKIGLESELQQLFEKAGDRCHDHVQAIIVPHAGYTYSGVVAASGYKQIDPESEYENIFVIASSHTAYYKGASIYSKGNYETPLGEVEVNMGLCQKLIHENEVFSFLASAHTGEHSLEVQLPFLQYYLKHPFRIIPIIIGSQEPETCKAIANALKPYFNPGNLFVISTDFSHYPEYNNALKVDEKTANAVISNSIEEFLDVLKKNEDLNIPNLATSMCGWTSVLCLLNMTREKQTYRYHKILYQNSGDANPFPDKSRVVGYYSMLVTMSREEKFTLSESDKANLLGIARLSMEGKIKNGSLPKLDVSAYSDNIKKVCGAFVTLTKNDELRGCIGTFEADAPLYSIVQEMAVAASTRDHRFAKVKEEELSDIELEISVLTPMKKIKTIDEIILGKHGIYIKKGTSSGTFLPQVAVETAWSLEEFLGYCARDKARIGWDGWRSADIYIYEALLIHE